MYCSGMSGVNGAMTCRIVSALRLVLARVTAVSKAFAEAFEKSVANMTRRIWATTDQPSAAPDYAGRAARRSPTRRAGRQRGFGFASCFQLAPDLQQLDE